MSDWLKLNTLIEVSSDVARIMQWVGGGKYEWNYGFLHFFFFFLGLLLNAHILNEPHKCTIRSGENVKKKNAMEEVKTSKKKKTPPGHATVHTVRCAVVKGKQRSSRLPAVCVVTRNW